MKNKLLLTGALLSITLLTAAPQFVKAETSAATVSFTGDDNTPTKPIDPTDPNNPTPTEPTDPGDPNNPGTGSAGPLSLDYVSNFDFGSNKIASTTQTYIAKADQPRIQVTDKRGTGAGWEVQAAISPIKTSDDDVLAGANLKLVNRSVVTNSQNTSAAPVATDITLSSSQKTVFKADKDAGLGTWLDNFDKNTSVLTVYGGTAKAKTYNATITWTLTSGPTGE